MKNPFKFIMNWYNRRIYLRILKMYLSNPNVHHEDAEHCAYSTFVFLKKWDFKPVNESHEASLSEK